MKKKDIILAVSGAVLSIIGGVMIYLTARNATLFEEKAEARFAVIDQRFDRLEKRVDKRIDGLEKRVDKMEATLQDLTKEVYKISGYLFAKEKK